MSTYLTIGNQRRKPPDIVVRFIMAEGCSSIRAALVDLHTLGSDSQSGFKDLQPHIALKTSRRIQGFGDFPSTITQVQRFRLSSIPATHITASSSIHDLGPPRHGHHYR